MLTLAKPFSPGMVLQRGKPVCVWGKAAAGARVTVSIQGRSTETTAAEDGNWQVWLPLLEASDREILTVECGPETVTVQDAAVGEVWIAGGQSNMEFPLRYEKHREEELKCSNPRLRFFDVPEKYYEQQDQDFDYSSVGIWRKAEGEDLPWFSAVGYYFQKELEEQLSVPVGVIGCNWGGTRSCAWMSEKMVQRVGKPWIEQWRKETAGVDLEAFLKIQRTDPRNDFGRPTTDPFNAYILPQTPSPEEIAAFFGEKSEEEPPPFELKNQPGILFREMVSKIAPYTARGVIWYQGEGDDMDGLQNLYADMMESLILDWRSAWKDEALPFFQVQLPGWRSWLNFTNHDFPAIRRCQEEVTRRLGQVYLASISDVGEELDIHPKEKKMVGHRLAVQALHYTYNQKDLLCEAPRPSFAVRRGDIIIITFQYAGDGLTCSGDTVTALKLIQDGRPISYTETLEGDQLILNLQESVKGPIEIHFAQEGWYQVNLLNSAGIPAIPFSLAV